MINATTLDFNNKNGHLTRSQIVSENKFIRNKIISALITILEKKKFWFVFMMYYDRSYKKVSKIIFHSMRRCLRYDPVFLRVWFGFLLRRVLITPQDKLLPWTHPYNFEGGGVVYTLINYLLQPCGKCRLSLLIHLSLERSIEILSRIKAKKQTEALIYV